MPAHLVHGDPFLASRKVKEIKRDFGLNDPSRYAEHHLDADSSDADAIATICRVPPFLEDARVVIAAGILAARELGQQRSSSQWDLIPRRHRDRACRQPADHG